MSCGVGGRCGSDLALLRLWRRLAATAPIRPLAWEPPYATGAALKKIKKKKKKKDLLLKHHRIKINGQGGFSSGLAVKDPVLLLLWQGFSPWPGDFHMPQAQPKNWPGREREPMKNAGRL